jgi:hypothetical protein
VADFFIQEVKKKQQMWYLLTNVPLYLPLNVGRGGIMLILFIMVLGHVIAHAFSRQLPTMAAWVQSQVMWDLWWKKWHWGQFSPSTSVSPASCHSTNCSIPMHHPGLVFGRRDIEVV